MNIYTALRRLFFSTKITINSTKITINSTKITINFFITNEKIIDN